MDLGGVMMVRDLDGMYFRVVRNGKPRNLCITDLTYDELVDVLQNRGDLWYDCVFEYLVNVYGDLLKLVYDEDACEDHIIALVGFLDKYSTPKDKVIEIVGVIQSFADECHIVHGSM